MPGTAGKRCVLTIAGSDSGGGAGVQADARTIHALGAYALTAVTAVTAQNTRGIASWRAVSPSLIAAQISAVLADFPVASVKTGLLPGTPAIRAVAAALRRHRKPPLVVDPVIASTGGTRFLSMTGIRALRRELLARATLVTPNWPEAEALSGSRIRTHADAEEAARRISGECGCAALVKGGHAGGDSCRDCLSTPDGRVLWFSSSRVGTRNTHGTGCVLSSAIAAGLAEGLALSDAVEKARDFLHRALVSGRGIRWGRGPGPAFAG